jgi:hypothetical protein
VDNDCAQPARCVGGTCVPTCNFAAPSCPRGFTCIVEDGGTNSYCDPPAGGCCVDEDNDKYGNGPGCTGPDCDDTRAATNPGASETCNNIDDDCDGSTDDNLGTTTCGTGACQLTVLNCVAGQDQTCTPKQPTAETCNNIDDDCDGSTDNMGTTTCGVGACRITVDNCVAGVPKTCMAGNMTAEVCDNIDNDCDGMTDENDPGGGMSCNTGKQGICSIGITACEMGGIKCVQQFNPQTEVCDSEDDDCDGTIDNNIPNVVCGNGECRRTVPGCMNGTVPNCVPGTPIPEICDGKDNDCNNITDEGFGTSTCGQGACVRTVQNCQNGMPQTCTPGNPVAEQCNGIDDDCNGATDNGNPGGGMFCPTGQLGQCAAGTTVCQSGGIQCIRKTGPTAELCDGIDNNCNGTTDEGNPGGGLFCPTGQQGVCSVGTTACMGGVPVCIPNRTPSAETCDGEDDDCDGVTDDNPNDVGGQCGQNCPGGLLANCRGECRPGTFVCQMGVRVCQGSTGPQTETCDNRDNDCDGTTDEGNPGGGGSCSTGQLGVCAAGTLTCSGGGLSCIRNQGPTGETCDSLDNDCDGATDENISIPDGRPNSCASAGNLVVTVSPGNFQNVSGWIDPSGDDYFVASFSAVPGAGFPYHPRLELTAGSSEYEMIVRDGCGVTPECNGGLTEFEMTYANNPGGCRSFGNCTDPVPRQTSWIVQVRRRNGPPTTCTQYTVRVSNQ